MKLKSLIAASAALLSTTTFAHVELGIYQGSTADGEACTIEALREWHEANLHHGLNHRVEIKAGGHTLTLSHPPAIDADAGTVRFDHDVLTGAAGLSKKGVAMILAMDHTPGNDGPTSLTILVDDYVDAASSTQWKCSNLQHVNP
jgi:hypothetical protein